MDFQPRPCPRCGSTASQPLLDVTGCTIFRSNWSYRPEALAELGAEADAAYPISECASCRFVFVPLLPSPATLEFVYDRAIDADQARERNLAPENVAAKMKFLSTLLALAPPMPDRLRLIDYGCGFGPTLEVLAGLTCVDAIGFETSKVRLNDLAQRGLRAVDDRAALLEAAPFALAVLDNVLEHLADPLETVRFVRSVCREGAILFVSVPERSASQLRELGRAGLEKLPMDINPWEHLNYFDLPQLDRLMGEAAFRPLGMRDLPAPVDIGLRPLSAAVPRAKNAVASALRMLGYVMTGDAVPSATWRFYRAA